MQYSEAKQGRTFIIRLEDGDILHRSIEAFAKKEGVSHASLIALGGADTGSRLVVGPEKGRQTPAVPMTLELYAPHEVTGTGTICPDDRGEPMLHMHLACGREENTVSGCVREGVRVWHVMEVILTELLESNASRQLDPLTGFKLLVP